MEDAGPARALAAELRAMIARADALGLEDVALHLNTALICLDGIGVVPDTPRARRDMRALAREVLPPPPHRVLHN